MYRNIDECLSDVYRFGALRIEPQGNTGMVMRWCENKGVIGGTSKFTQVEWHANAAMIQARINRVLSRFECAVIGAKYGADFSGLAEIAVALYGRGAIKDMALAYDLLQHIYSGNLKRVAIMDKHNLARMTFHRKREAVKKVLAEWENTARLKLDDEFRARGIITA